LNLNKRNLILITYLAETCKEYDAKLFHYVSIIKYFILYHGIISVQ